MGNLALVLQQMLQSADGKDRFDSDLAALTGQRSASNREYRDAFLDLVKVGLSPAVIEQIALLGARGRFDILGVVSADAVSRVVPLQSPADDLSGLGRVLVHSPRQNGKTARQAAEIAKRSGLPMKTVSDLLNAGWTYAEHPEKPRRRWTAPDRKGGSHE